MALSRDEVLAGALTLLDKVGLDALTMRRLAQALGVQAGAIYWHFKNKQELVDAMADELIAGIASSPLTGSWEEQLGEIGRRMAAGLMRRRDGARLASQALKPGPNTLANVETMLRVIAASGQPQERVLWTASVLGYYILGFVTDVQAQAEAVRHRGLDRLVREFFETELDAEAYPEMSKIKPRQVTEMMKVKHAQARFEFGLGIILRGLTNGAAAAAPTEARARRTHRRR
jgi:TetR/AcrR family tetracycline transcriptional repressor